MVFGAAEERDLRAPAAKARVCSGDPSVAQKPVAAKAAKVPMREHGVVGFDDVVDAVDAVDFDDVDDVVDVVDVADFDDAVDADGADEENDSAEGLSG